MLSDSSTDRYVSVSTAITLSNEVWPLKSSAHRLGRLFHVKHLLSQAHIGFGHLMFESCTHSIEILLFRDIYMSPALASSAFIDLKE